MDELEENVRKLVLSFQELFECPVCFGTMDSALKHCINGHAVCSNCASKIEKCPSCQQELIIQNTLLRQILERLPKPCPYTDKGCEAIVFDQEHQTYCEYRTTECKKIGCGWEGCVRDLIDHLRTCFDPYFTNELPLNMEESRKYSSAISALGIISPIKHKNQIFWKYFKIKNVTNGVRISHRLYHLPTSKPSGDYYMILTFKKGYIEFKHTCKATIDTNNADKDMTEHASCIEIPNLLAEKFFASSKVLDYTLKLVKEDFF